MGVLAELQEIKSELKKATIAQKRVLSLDEVVEYFGIAKRTLYVLTSKKLIPHSKKSGLWFKREDVENWLLSNPITTDAELDEKATLHILRNRR